MTDEEESGQENQRNTGNVNGDVDLDRMSMNDVFIKRWLDYSYGVVVVGTILEEMVSNGV